MISGYCIPVYKSAGGLPPWVCLYSISLYTLTFSFSLTQLLFLGSLLFNWLLYLFSFDSFSNSTFCFPFVAASSLSINPGRSKMAQKSSQPMSEKWRGVQCNHRRPKQARHQKDDSSGEKRAMNLQGCLPPNCCAWPWKWRRTHPAIEHVLRAAAQRIPKDLSEAIESDKRGWSIVICGLEEPAPDMLPSERQNALECDVSRVLDVLNVECRLSTRRWLALEEWTARTITICDPRGIELGIERPQPSRRNLKLG